MLENLLLDVYKKPMEDLLNVDSTALSSYIKELKTDEKSWNIVNQVYERNIRKGVKNFVPLYVICREAKPEKVIEIGVANGVSSYFILKSMEVNQKGSLYSIDFQTSRYREFMSGKDIGWIIPNYLKSRWNLILGKSTIVLPDILKQVGKIQIFLHDSSHDYETMMYEFGKSWPEIEDGGFLLSDDINRNSAFNDFSKIIGYSFNSIDDLLFKSEDRFGILKKVKQ